jgi:hypothetical protein
MTVGYSGTPLVRKLGLKSGMKVALVDGPEHYWELLPDLPTDVSVADLTTPSLDFIHVFVRERRALEDQLPGLRTKIRPDGMIWVSWPKKAAKVPTDVTEDVVREIALPIGLVDVKVCAVDEVWSGLKLVIRKAERS